MALLLKRTMAEPVAGSDYIGTALQTVDIAMRAVDALHARFHEEGFAAAFTDLIERIIAVRGRVIVAGMGKSGIIGRKLVATLSSTGTPSMFLHPAEAGHGDLGMITSDDLVLVISRSGETAELAPIIEYCKRFGVPLVAVTTRGGSTVANAADLAIRLPSVREACPNELTPTTSTTVQLVFGDALAMALMGARGFSAEDFHRFHPAGRLGARLLKVNDVMAGGDDVPRVGTDASLLDATVEMTRTRLGGTAVVDGNDRLIGAFTDGDLRRSVTGGRQMTDRIGDLMTRMPLWIGPDELASEAVRLMHARNVLMLFVCEGERLVGVLHMHDVLRAGVL